MSVPLDESGNQNETSRPEEEELPQNAQEFMDTAEAFDDSGNTNEDVNITEEDAGNQVEDEEDLEDDAGGNEQGDDGDGKSDDEDEEEEIEVVGLHHRCRSQVRSRTTKDANADLFDSFEFGENAGSARQSMANIEDLESLQEASEKWMPANSCNTAHLKDLQRFVCIDYPGIVKNKEKAMATLGGLTQIAEAKKKETKLELHFRPDDPFCKPTIGSFTKMNNMLIKCKRRKAPDDSPSSSQGDGFEYKIEVVGVVDGLFNFNIPADYQFLPVVKEKDGSMRELLSDIILKFEDEREDYLCRDVPLFVPPYTFARHERPAKYYFQPDAVVKEDDDATSGSARKSRAIGTQVATFKEREVPKEAKEESWNNLQKYPEERIKACAEPLKKLFEKRPLWTRTSMMANMPTQAYYLLKQVLPTISYYIVSGPWRGAWCKFGYDPQKHPEAKHYQVIEFRIRTNINLKKIKSPTFGFHGKARAGPKQDPTTGDKLESAGTSAGETPSMEMDVKYQFLPWRLPPHSHMFYQVCDIMEDRIQQMVHENDGQETECNERDGWCVPEFTAKCRDILTLCTDNLIS